MVSTSLYKRIKIHAAMTGRDVKSIIIELVGNTLDGKEEGYRIVTKENNLVYNLLGFGPVTFFLMKTTSASLPNLITLLFALVRKMTGGSLTEEEIQEYVETQVEISTASVRTELDPFKTVVETKLDSIEKSQEIRFDSVDKRIDSLSW